jgi:heme/copper-type cytochrome/quinol oxidase subunit 2
MTPRQYLADIVPGLVLVALLLALLDPLDAFMPPMVAMTIIVLLVVFFSVFIIFMWREQPRDEREHLHALAAGKIAYMVGGGILVIAIALEAYRHTLDPWLVYALSGMIAAKIATTMYQNITH